MQRQIETIHKAGIQVVSVSYDSVEALKKFAEKEKIGFPLLSDRKSEAIKSYGVLDKREKEGTSRFGHAYPVTFVIDSNSLVHAILIGTTRKRHSVKQLIDTVK